MTRDRAGTGTWSGTLGDGRDLSSRSRTVKERSADTSGGGGRVGAMSRWTVDSRLSE